MREEFIKIARPYSRFSRNKCLALATGYFYRGEEANSWYWLFKAHTGL